MNKKNKVKKKQGKRHIFARKSNKSRVLNDAGRKWRIKFARLCDGANSFELFS